MIPEELVILGNTYLPGSWSTWTAAKLDLLNTLHIPRADLDTILSSDRLYDDLRRDRPPPR